MSERRDIIREFSTFCVLDDRNGHKFPVFKSDRKLERILNSLIDDALRVNKDTWARYFLLVARQSDPRVAASLSISEPSNCMLQHVIERLVELAPELNQDVQAVYLQIVARRNDQIASFLNSPVPIVEKLLSAHLQKICWYAANDFHKKRIQFSNLRYQYPLEECFQIASLRASEPINLLKNFDFGYRHITIKSYAEKRLWGIISDKIRSQNLEAKTKSFSDDGLLKTLSKTELIEALKVTNHHQLEINCYCLAWQCYKEIYQPKQINHNQLAPPAKQQIQQIAERYNQRRQEFEIFKLVNGNDISIMLKACVQIVKTYRSSDSLTKRIHNESSDLFTDPWNALMQNEEAAMHNNKLTQVRSIIAKSFAELPDAAQKTLRLWFGLELTQTDILLLLGLRLGVQKQYEISRRIKNYKKTILKALTEELSEKYPDIFQPKNKIDKIISQMQNLTDECLVASCKNYFYSPLEYHLQFLQRQEKLLLRLHYRQHLPEQQIAEQLEFLVSEVNTKLVNLKHSLQAIFKQWVETTLDIALGLCSSVDQKLASFVKMWLQEYANLEV